MAFKPGAETSSRTTTPQRELAEMLVRKKKRPSREKDRARARRSSKGKVQFKNLSGLKGGKRALPSENGWERSGNRLGWQPRKPKRTV